MMLDSNLNTEGLKMTRMSLVLPLLFGVSITGCAGHPMMRGSVVMKLDPTTAHVCLGKGDVQVNDRVSLYRNTCATNRSLQRTECRREVVGEGKVTELLSDHFSTVVFPEGTTVEEGFTVEKAR